ncbi:MAG: hypothetical protein EWM72_00153 [Nitrospira sp.]|nr:MAG: hypothetical protein EWM72_00153 [Nitrospira sp.]
MDRRKHPRFAVDYRCEYFGEHFAGEGRVLDLSKEGARLCSGASVARGDYLKMVIALPHRDGLLRVELATTRWSRGREFGVEFIRMDPEQQRRLQNCLQGFAVEESPAAPSVSGKMTMANRRNRIPREILIARFPTYRSLGTVAAVMLAILLGLDVPYGSAKQGRRDQVVPVLETWTYQSVGSVTLVKP